MKIQSNQRVCQFSKITLQIYFLTLTYVSAHDIYVNISNNLKENTEIYTKNNHEKLIICTIKLTDKSRKSNRFWSNDIENLNFFVIICTGKRYFNLALLKARDKTLKIIAYKLSKTLLRNSRFRFIFVRDLVKIQSYKRVCQFSKVTLQIYFLT